MDRLVWGTQVELITAIFIILEFCLFIFQLARYFYRPQDKHRGWFLLLLFLMLLYNITGGLFPDPKITGISLPLQEMIAYGTGFLMASYFPFYFYRAMELNALRWHALFGVPLFLISPYFVFFVVVYAINGELNVDIRFGMIVPFIYALILLWAMFRAIRKKYTVNRDRKEYLEEIGMYSAVTPWAALAFFGLVEASQLIEVLCTNTGIIVISILFLATSVKNARTEYRQATERNPMIDNPVAFQLNCTKHKLTAREIEIVFLLVQGVTYKAIGENLFIAEKTVDNHVQRIYEKTGVKNKIALLHKLNHYTL